MPRVDWFQVAGFVFILGACAGGLGRVPVAVPVSLAGLCAVSLPGYWARRPEAEKAGKGPLVRWVMAGSVLNSALAVFAGYGLGTVVRWAWFG